MKQKTFVAALKFLREFSTSHDVRYFLCGINIERTKEGWDLVASNGHILGAVHISEPDGDEWSGIIPINEVKYLMSIFSLTKRDPDCDISIELDNKDLVFINYRYQIGFPAIDGNYPDWRKTLEDAKGGTRGHSMGVNPEYMEKVGKAAKQLNHDGLKLFCRGQNVAARVEIPLRNPHEGMESAEALIMPMTIREAKS